MAISPDLIQESYYRIRTCDIDPYKTITIPALLQVMHEAAMQNVMRLKVSVWDLETHSLSWVLMRLQLHIERRPSLGEEIKIVTHPSGFERLFTYRDYKVYDADENCIAWATSTWLLMDTQKRRMTRIPPFILAFKMPEETHCLPRAREKMPSVEQVDSQTNFKVRWHHLDFNHHLGNVEYCRWMLDSLPEQQLMDQSLQVFDIIYRAEALLHEQVVSELQQVNEEECLLRLRRKSDDKELALAQLKWVAKASVQS